MKPTRAITHHEEMLLEQRSCLGCVIVALALGAFLHPCLHNSSPNCFSQYALAADSPAAGVLSSPTDAVGDWHYSEAEEEYWREIDPLDFTGSDFAMPPDDCTAPAELPMPLIEYIGADAAALLVAATRRVYSETGHRVSYYMLACIAKRESGGKVDAVSPSGYYHGLLQIGRLHRAAMQRMGLVWDDPSDMTYYGACLYLWQGDKPWSTRYSAKREYNKHGFSNLEVQSE